MLDRFFIFLDSYFAEFIFHWEPVIIFLIGILVSVVLWCIDPKRIKKYIQNTLVVVILVLSCCLAVYTQHVKESYTYVPDVNLGQHSFRDFEERCASAGLYISYENLKLDEVAEEMASEIDLYSYYFKVTQVNPEPNTFLLKGEKITLNLTWENDFTSKVLEMPEISDFDAVIYYGNIDNRYLHPYNADSFSLATAIAGAKVSSEERFDRWLDVYPEAEYPFTASLINFETGDIVQTKTGVLGETITFRDIPNGTYYYIVECDGFHPAVPGDPFRLQYNPDNQEDELPWLVGLQAKDSVSGVPFSLTFIDSFGSPISGTEVDVRVVSTDNTTPTKFSHVTYRTDDTGVVCQRWWRDNKEYMIEAEFVLFEGYQLEARLNDQGQFISVQYADGVGICVISD